MASMTQEERKWEAQYSYLLPLLRYHDRWYQLSEEDFRYWFTRDPVTHNGYLMQTGVKPYVNPYMERPRTSYAFGENSWYYLERIVSLCEEKGVQLILLKAPSMYPVWWDQWDAQIAEYAQAKNLPYLNMLDYQEEIGIDWNKDTYDAGLHLNVYGAEKASVWFGEILSETYAVPDRRSDAELNALWAEKTAAYAAEKEKLEAEQKTQEK